MKHTKGNWIAIETNGFDASTFETEKEAIEFRDNSKEMTADNIDWIIMPVNQATAAPELFEACKEFTEAPGSKTMGYYSDEQVNAIDKMKQAIQNAES